MTVGHDDVVGWIRAFAAVVEDNRAYLTKLDSAIGDADHGSNLHRGFQAVVAKLEGTEENDVGKTLKTVGMTLVSKVGGAGGPLYGTLFMQMGGPLTGKARVTPQEFAAALESGVKGVQARGKAELEDKTMLDALLPAVDAISSSLATGANLQEALERAAEAAAKGMEATTPMVAKKGRASYLGERSAGHQDPGATSSYLLLKAASDTLSKVA